MPRPRFQFHLTTGLALMLVASTLLFLNLRDSYDPGWPLKLYPEWPEIQLTVVGDPTEIFNPSIPAPEHFEPIQRTPLLLNILIALAILTFTAVLSEFLIRRRTSATPSLAESPQ